MPIPIGQTFAQSLHVVHEIREILPRSVPSCSIDLISSLFRTLFFAYRSRLHISCIDTHHQQCDATEN